MGIAEREHQPERIRVSGIEIEWHPEQGVCTFDGLPIAMLWIDTTLCGVMHGVQAMVGTRRFLLALQSEGRKSVEADWRVISRFPSFPEGFAAIANVAAVAGWGRWELTRYDPENRECRFRVKDSWEGHYQRSAGVRWGSGLLAGKLAGYCSKLFGTNCWADQTAFAAAGAEYDEFVVKPSSKLIETELESLLAADEATRADMAVALRRLEAEVADRLKTEASLRESEARFRALVENLGEGVALVDLNERIVFANRAAEEIFDVEAGGLIGRSLLEFVSPADVAMVQKETQQRRAGKPSVYELEVFHERAGDTRTISVSATPLPDSAGQVSNALGVFHDISERKRAEQALRASEQLNREIISSAQEGIIVYDSELRYRVWNPFMEELTGVRAAEVMGRSPLEMFPHLAEQHVDEFLRRALGGETVSSPDIPFQVRRTGRSGWVSGTYWPHRGPNGEVIGVIATIHDVTERKRAEEALRLSEERLRLALEATRVGTLDWDLASDSGYSSPRLASLLGYEPGELAFSFEAWKGMVHPDDLTGWLEDFPERRNKNQKSDSSEYRMRHKSGRYIWVESHRRVVSRAADGSPLRVMATLSDITERKSVQEQLIQAQKMESVGRLAGGIAHDFNNLLTVINGYSDILLGSQTTDERMRRSLTEVRKAGQRAAELTRQLLAFSRKQMVELKAVDLNQVISENRDLLGRLIGEDVELVTNLAPSLGQVLADPGQLLQVLMNLTGNARDAMPQGGRLTIATKNLELDQAAAAAHPDAQPGAYVSLEVADTGMGIDPKVRQWLFDPFFTTKGEGKGTGLGLATVYGIVRQSGGWIDVESDPGEGATFRIGLPCIPVSASTGVVLAPEPGDLSGTETILLVEDQEQVRRLASTVLTGFGYRVKEAASGDEALSMAGNHAGPIHLLLTDMVMPGMTGRELALRLRGSHPGMQVLYMSGYSEDLIARSGAPDANVACIPKPFRPEELAAKVRAVLNAGNSRSRILVVDDEDEVRTLLVEILRSAGYEVVSARNGNEALEQLETQNFSLVVADLVMPDREGIETIRDIRQGYPESKIVAVSGAFGGSYLKMAELLGADATLPKPIEPRQLLAAVCKLLG